MVEGKQDEAESEGRKTCAGAARDAPVPKQLPVMSLKFASHWARRVFAESGKLRLRSGAVGPPAPSPGTFRQLPIASLTWAGAGRGREVKVQLSLAPPVGPGNQAGNQAL